MTTKKLKAQSSKRKRSSNGQNSKSPNAHSSQVERAPGFGAWDLEFRLNFEL
jgi:hypothetical protein